MNSIGTIIANPKVSLKIISIILFVISCTRDNEKLAKNLDKGDSVNLKIYDSIAIKNKYFNSESNTFASLFLVAKKHSNKFDRCQKTDKDTTWFSRLSLKKGYMYVLKNQINKSYATKCDSFTLYWLDDLKLKLLIKDITEKHSLFYVFPKPKQSNGFYILNKHSKALYFVNCHDYVDYANVWSDYKNISSISTVDSQYMAKSTLYFYSGIAYKKEDIIDSTIYYSIISPPILNKDKDTLQSFEIVEDLTWNRIEQMLRVNGISSGKANKKSRAETATYNW